MVEVQNKIMALVNSGQLQSARQECLNACNKSPDNAQLWFMLSAICGQTQDFPAAEQYCRKALEITDSVPSIYYNLAVAQRGQGKTNDAVFSLEKAVQLQANFTAALYELGNICLEQKNYANAIDYYQKVINGAPDTFQAYTGMAIAQERQGEPGSAKSAYLESLRINPVQQDVVLRLASLCDTQENVDDAIQYYKRAIEFGYNKADVYVNLGRMYVLHNNQSEAENNYKKALSTDPDAVEALTNLALLYEEMQNTGSALENIKKAYQLKPEDEKVIYNYAKILTSRREYSEAETFYRKVLDINPGFSEAGVNLGNLYLLSGKVNDAQGIYEYTCNNKPDYHIATSNYLVSLNYSSNHSDIEIRDIHIERGKQIEKDIKQLEIKQSTNHEATPLKVGYVSPDFRNHSVAYFLEGILKHSNKNNVTNFCYSDVINKDDVTKRFEELSDYWRDVSMFDDKALAELVQQDDIDILIDLCGHISGNRLPMFALKPAAIQITYLGYPNTTGLSTMDYRIIDQNTDPEGSEEMMTESPLYIEPCFISYSPYENSPDVSRLPALKNGYVTFGSFNNLAKMSDEVIDVWSKILIKTPDSKLCIKARQYADTIIKSEHIKRFKKAGIDESRLQFLTYSNTTTEHLQMYNSIDIALDTFPYNGTTTTFEAMWMGVPVVCFTGTRHASRVGMTILKNLDTDELLADNQQQYIDIACNLAADIEKLQEIREQLRPQMLGSPLLDIEDFSKKFESALIGIKSKN